MADTNDEDAAARVTRRFGDPAQAYGSPMAVEQARNLLVFRFGCDPEQALDLLLRWAAESGSSLEHSAGEVLRELGEAGGGAEPEAPFARWLHERLGQEQPVVPEQRLPVDPSAHVRVAVEESEESLEQVVAAAREAYRLGVPLELEPHEGASAEHHALILQRLDSALQVARTVAPGLDVRLPATPEPAGDQVH